MRPSKEVRYKRNGDSIQIYEGGNYLGSQQLKILYQRLKEELASGTKKELAQKNNT